MNRGMAAQGSQMNAGSDDCPVPQKSDARKHTALQLPAYRGCRAADVVVSFRGG